MSGYYIIPFPDDYLHLSGGTVTGNTFFSANLSASTAFLTNTPTNNNFSNYVLVYNNTTNAIEYRDASSIGVLGNFLPISGGTLTGPLNAPEISGTTITGSTFYSGSTPLQDIFPYSGTNIGIGEASVFAQKNNGLLEFRTFSAGTNISLQQSTDTIAISFTGNTIPNIEDGLNTYTATTVNSGLTINVSGLTIDNLTVTGDTNIWNLSAYSVSATTIYSGNTPIDNIFPYSGTNIGLGSQGIFAQKNNGLLEFKTLSAGTRIFLTGTSDSVTIQTSGVNSYYIQQLAPSGTTEAPLYDGDRWFNTTDGIELVWIDDGNSSQWVEIVTSITGTNVSSGTVNYIGKFDSSTTLTDTATPMFEGANGIVVGSTSIDQSAIFEINSSSLGFLPPRLTEAQLNSITNPAVGLMVYQTNGVEGVYVFKSDNTWHLLG